MESKTPSRVFSNSPRWMRFGLALVLPACAFGLTLAAWPLFAGAPSVMFFAAVSLAAWQGGRTWGVISALLSSLLLGALLAAGDTRVSSGAVAPALAVLQLAVGILIASLITRGTSSTPSEDIQNEWLRSTLASVGDAVIATDGAGNVAFMNPIAEQLTCWPQAEATGRPLREVFVIVNEFTRHPVDNPVDKVLRTGRIVGLANHTVLVGRDGTEVPIDDSAAPIYGKSQRPEGVVLVFRDITERRRAELVREHLAAIVESSDDIIASKTLDGVITSWNKGAERALGYSADEVVGHSVSMLIPPETNEDFRIILEQVAKGAKVDHYETKRRRKDGTLIDVSLTVSPIRDAYGRIVGASKIGRDITERRLAERRKDEFLAMLSHELRNPLSAIRGALSLYHRGEAEHDREWAIDVITRQAQQLGSLIDDLLDVSRITQAKIKLDRRVVDAAEVINNAVEASRPLVEGRRHALSVTVPTGNLWVDADPVRLEQVVMNLLTNAAKYTEPGGRIWLEAGRSGTDVTIRVRDTGIGIAPDLLPRVFELFTQGDRSLARSDGGLGIGLTLVKALVEMHGGTVSASSPGPGLGSEFVIRLPAAEAPVVPMRGAVAPRIGTPKGGQRILVVDDNVDTVRSLTRLLKLSSYNVRAAYNGQEAIAIAHDFHPDVVLLDIGLPGMDGIRVAETLRDHECCKDADFIAMTGYGSESDRAKTKVAGFDEHFVKPLDFDTLLDTLARLGEESQ